MYCNFAGEMICQKAEKAITLIDGYVDVGNFNAQYPALEVKYIRAFHDRFLILDRETAYHVGASLKDAGKKCFGINLIQDEGIIRDMCWFIIKKELSLLIT